MKSKLTFRSTIAWLMLTAMALSLVTAHVAAESSESEPIVVNKSPSMVTFVGGTAKAMGRLKVRIARPDGQTVYESVSEAGILDWMPDANLLDGRYRWDAWFVPEKALHDRRVLKPANEVRVRYRSGQFRVRDGAIQAGEGVNDQPDQASKLPTVMERLVGRLMATLVPSAKAGANHNDFVFVEDNEEDSITYVTLDAANSDGSLLRLWRLGNTAGRLDFSTSNDFINFNPRMSLTNSAHLGVGTPNPAVPLHIADTTPRLRFEDTDGFGDSGPTAWTISASSDEFRLQDNDGGGRPIVVDAGGDSGGAPTNSLFIAADGDIGVGTSTPETDLHVVGSSGSLTLEGTFASQKWAHFLSADGDYLIQDRNTFLVPFIVSAGAPSGSIDIGATGNVGIGALSPAAPLHVQRGGGSAQVLVEDTDTSDTSPLQLFKLLNHGFPVFNLQDTSQPDVRWSFRISGTQDDDERFTITKLGTTVPEFTLFHDGSAEFQGDVTADGVLLTSSREMKTDFSPVDEHTVLKKVASLDVSQWRYKREPGTERHIGPMAEDFREVFGLGDGRHISAGDAQGILFAAAKALQAEEEILKTRMGELEAQNNSLQAENRELRARLERIESRLGLADG